MSNYKNETRNLESDNMLSNPTCIFHLKEVCLYCTNCQDPVCAKCLVEKHQNHSFSEISDAIEVVKERVVQWCTEQSGISTIKAKLNNLMENSKQAETSLEADLRIHQIGLKNRIDDEANQLSGKLKEAFQRHESLLQQRIDEVADCEKGFENFKVKTTTHANIVQLYCKMKNCMSEEYLTEVNSLNQPILCLDTGIEGSIGIIKPDSDDERMSQVAKTDIEKAEITVGNIVDPIRITTDMNGSSNNAISKIVPLGNEEAWVISERKLYYLKQSKFTLFECVTAADDIVRLEHSNLLILQRDSTIINQMNSKEKVSLFTRTDPRVPRRMAYVEKDKSLMVLLDDSSVVLFGLDGIKKQKIKLPFGVDVQCLDAVSCAEFAVVDTYLFYLQNIGVPRYRISYFKGEPLKRECFVGIFGYDSSSTFLCKGICYDDEGRLIVSDFNYNAVYRLDKQLRKQNILIEQQAGLNQPTALALTDGMLWVADSKYISVYKYSEMASC